MKSPECRSSGLFGTLLVQTTSGGCPVVIPAADSSSALGALAIHRSGLESAFFQPARRRMFWLAEDHRVAAESSASWNFQGGLGIQLRLCRLQSGAHAESEPSDGLVCLTRDELALTGVKARPQK
jgi:hypothetical protein